MAKVNEQIGNMRVAIDGDEVVIKLKMEAPHPSASGKRNLRFTSRGRQRIPGADKDLTIMVNLDERRS
jgi:hypothetical protein